MQCESLVACDMQPATALGGECPSLIYPLTSIIERLDLAKLFPAPQPLEVELGCGDSSFLVEYARRLAGHNFIGVERLLGRLRKLDRKGRRAGLMSQSAVVRDYRALETGRRRSNRLVLTVAG